MASTTSFNHPSIGTFKGSTAKDGVVQFLGVQYATLAHRFAPTVMKDYPEATTIDATKVGPYVLGQPGGPDFEFKLLQQSLEYDRDALTMSDIEGLNLSITMPAVSDGSPMHGRNLPVVAFIHGGGFNNGSGGFPQYDMTRVVRLSVARGLPIIAVSLNYRTGAPGFLSGAELERAGCLPNNGLRDQRTALLWLAKYISGFGGNPDEITCLGESAGAASTAYHMHSEKPLFKRAMLMSGSLLLNTLTSREDADKQYWRGMEVLGLTDKTEGERVRQLLQMDGQELRGELLQAGVMPKVVLDGDICPTPVTFKSFTDGSLQLHGKSWCKGLIIGDCQFDGSIIGLALGRRKSGIAPAFCASVSSTLPSHIATKLLSSYDLDPSTPDDEAYPRVLEVANDIFFYSPTVVAARALSPHMPVHVYRFNEPNTWPGPWQGRATHIHDLTFLLNNFNEKMSPEQARLAEEFAGDLVGFVHGEKPWQAFGEGGKAKVLKAGDGCVKVDEPSEVDRRGAMGELAGDVGYDALAAAMGRFIAG